MIKIKVYNQQGVAVGEKSLNEKIFGVKAQSALVEQVVVAERANARRPLAHTKTKGEVRGGGRKPWRQKGTGRARQGSIRAPQWRGGGVVFGPRKERHYDVRINKKMKRKALLMALSDKVINERLVVLDHLDVGGKTKDWHTLSRGLWSSIVPTLHRQPTILLITPTISMSIKRSVQNVPNVSAIRADSLNISSILKHAYTLTTVEGVDFLERWLAIKKKAHR
ncbi:50S ribosomal protein L4 [Candidatus Uhrbacteria bacterium RIFCSPLOWO2_12_FULL_46_10]|uniref:Large ribosomal subunit protein uL4 n=1 Tax=Candidatus Uhrbacteria bacterium RIFCSPLOWO2_01_FULL_47_25 TaxID=1802402 RepID=A0A1F7UX03_9BACT|nr:MAG: 50S ribosomal protein L4 [Candidatus Uhrbacteria bacterium RIFCSPHIGHO2_01_FULL_46_23]OGL70268.1 MAG: 50S ribosomal protein L4 [Candidatus Uhrbacteria bacterium RIFCSPHIGHO2_02_FULL_47_29]OGL74689.1 MAG: 50S ribosomal protein L4 [Candidatus Uhrbacteria bacterium RIFCSPHIGHO2_12_FULL_46_13]OGL82805.1 MAG: 50S ribosomal protein L4 [Candidatus Uhrbacteria bacterium RIFCSPLOWO2_01_FULL_47_25]OGL83899.1 MAG: 50S ribosomal protein L4 [Candidatus Uhrbacteria bacterium RIFCSPLOWO2_02_FULL_46_19